MYSCITLYSVSYPEYKIILKENSSSCRADNFSPLSRLKRYAEVFADYYTLRVLSGASISVIKLALIGINVNEESMLEKNFQRDWVLIREHSRLKDPASADISVSCFYAGDEETSSMVKRFHY